MAKPIKIVEGFNESIEEFGFALGEAEDFCDRVEPLMYDLISGIVQGRISPADARRKVWEEFTNARADIVRWRNQRGVMAFEYKYKHLDVESFPFVRIMAELPTDRPKDIA